MVGRGPRQVNEGEHLRASFGTTYRVVSPKLLSVSGMTRSDAEQSRIQAARGPALPRQYQPNIGMPRLALIPNIEPAVAVPGTGRADNRDDPVLARMRCCNPRLAFFRIDIGDWDSRKNNAEEYQERKLRARAESHTFEDRRPFTALHICPLVVTCFEVWRAPLSSGLIDNVRFATVTIL